jgi:hypothetical protein
LNKKSIEIVHCIIIESSRCVLLVIQRNLEFERLENLRKEKEGGEKTDG